MADVTGSDAMGDDMAYETPEVSETVGKLPVEVRQVSRVVLLDGDDRVLLLNGYEPSDPARTWLFTPGGGLEGEETREEAARRELAEETGITDVRLGPLLWKRRCAFPFDGRRWEQDEWYYLARTDRTATEMSGQTDLERRSVSGLRWWTLEDLSASHETVYPTGFVELLRRLLDEGPPDAPVLLATESV
ncbi:DNA mismatch repair protein MutT [Streptomyces paromomycinus]|uniref:DNA mismatch repair protein MutT n=2 Tax=Streptomyces paromomycinus TaxID=92743 RepID=A0A401W095_STREY|nr:DNA mismatch repair protein MutT [Streptomyces paromomycinus]